MVGYTVCAVSVEGVGLLSIGARTNERAVRAFKLRYGHLGGCEVCDESGFCFCDRNCSVFVLYEFCR